VKVMNKKRKYQSLFKHLCHWERVEVITNKKNYLNPQWMRQQVEQIKTRFWLSEPSRFSFGRWNNNPIYVDVYNFMENLYDLGLPMLGN